MSQSCLGGETGVNAMNRPTCGRGRLEVAGASPTRYPRHYAHYSKHSLPDSESTLACYTTPKSTPNRIRTCDPRLRRPLLYPAELSGLIYNFQRLRRKHIRGDIGRGKLLLPQSLAGFNCTSILPRLSNRNHGSSGRKGCMICTSQPG